MRFFFIALCSLHFKFSSGFAPRVNNELVYSSKREIVPSKTRINVLPILPALVLFPLVLPTAALVLPQIFDKLIETQMIETLDIDPAKKIAIESQYNTSDSDDK
jgi:hypothetical protein